ncbi:hypothetical protein [Micromonospora sp. NPDC049891]|uniref:hypothetical protein n=1 Tax=Micromonospora sp. NPDC049891 TaxID=3155655 RepID=UPI00340FDA0D
MPRYQLDDPALQTELDRLAAAEAADWPVTDVTLAKLARILPAANATADRNAVASHVPSSRRAAA